MTRTVKVRHCPRPEILMFCRFCNGAFYRRIPPCTCPWCGKLTGVKP